MATKRKGVQCYLKAELDEPVFVLRGQDALAPMVVEFWADMAEKLAVPYDKIQEARDCANEMKNWPTRKLPD